MKRTLTSADIAVPRRQRGAALVVGLILLLVLTILAVSGMSSASLEFFMAGNEQYRQQAFQAAETGIQQAMAQATFTAGSTTAVTVTGSLSGSSSEAYSAVVTPQLNGTAVAAPSGNSKGKFVAYHWEIVSSGSSSTRSSSAVHVQGVYLRANADDSYGQDSTSGSSGLN